MGQWHDKTRWQISTVGLLAEICPFWVDTSSLSGRRCKVGSKGVLLNCQRQHASPAHPLKVRLGARTSGNLWIMTEDSVGGS